MPSSAHQLPNDERCHRRGDPLSGMDPCLKPDVWLAGPGLPQGQDKHVPPFGALADVDDLGPVRVVPGDELDEVVDDVQAVVVVPVHGVLRVGAFKGRVG